MAKAFNLTPRVREDLRAIWRYTAEICNETQADAYGSSDESILDSSRPLVPDAALSPTSV